MLAFPDRLVQKIHAVLAGEFGSSRACGAPDPGTTRQRFGVAISGGPDSAMLAVAAADYATSCGLELHLFHIHHGLQRVADEWQHRVHDLAHQLAVPCHSRRVVVQSGSGKGVEAAAREARYTALADLARQAGVQVMLLGHHQHDQAETVLLRLLRGAGPAGLSAMSVRSEREGLVYLRPWLDVGRDDILQVADRYAQETGWQYVTDPTNTQDRYTRAAVRQRLAPVLDERWPGWRDRLVRHAEQASQTREVLDEVAHADLMALDFSEQDRSFSLLAWRGLSTARQALVLRYWLAMQGLMMPSQARLEELMRQLRQLHALGFDRALALKHAGATITCRQGRVMLLDEGGSTL